MSIELTMSCLPIMAGTNFPTLRNCSPVLKYLKIVTNIICRDSCCAEVCTRCLYYTSSASHLIPLPKICNV